MGDTLQVDKKHIFNIRNEVNLPRGKIEYLLRDIPATDENDNDTAALLIEDVLKSHSQTIDEICEKIKVEASNGG
jgi:hypothetical protein